jgi:hypothetical protein
MAVSHDHEPGCCVDRRFNERHPGANVEGCNDHTCMRLPAGRTCADCFAVAACEAIYGANPTNTVCTFFPRRFRLPVVSAEAVPEERPT